MKVWLRSFAAFGVLASSQLFGCGSSDSGASAPCSGGSCVGVGATGPGGCDGGCWHPSSDDNAFVDTLCSTLSNCCTRRHDPRDVPAPSVADHVAWCSYALLETGFSHDPALQSACLTEATEAGSGTACMPGFWPPSPTSACARLLFEPNGPVAVQSRCAAASDCASKVGLVSWCGAPTGTAAYCQSWSPGKEGNPCVVTFADDFLAVPVPVTALTGRSCSVAAGLVCLPVDASSSGHFCRPLLADGAACLWPFECASHVCSPTASNFGSCGPAFVPSALPDGSSCTDGKNCASAHCLLDACQPAAEYSAEVTFCAQ